jgi:hypothetical protein
MARCVECGGKGPLLMNLCRTCRIRYYGDEERQDEAAEVAE